MWNEESNLKVDESSQHVWYFEVAQAPATKND